MADKSDQEIAALEKEMGELKAKLEKAGAATTELDALKKQMTELQAKLDKAEDEKKTLTAVAQLTDVEKAWYDNLKSKKKDDEDEEESEAKKFLSLPADERKAIIAKHEEDLKKGDESVEIEGQKIFKSKVGSEQFAIFKAQAARLKKAEDDIAKAKDEALTVSLQKQADDMFKHILGKTEDKVGVLKSLRKLPDAEREQIEKVMSAADKVMKLAFEWKGHDGDPDKLKKGREFEKLAADIKKRDNCSHVEAMRKAREENPEAFEAYQEAGRIQTQ